MSTNAVAKLPVRPVRSQNRALPQREATPFIKWVGGKGKLEKQLSLLYPPGVELMRHVEPFMGGGALFFARSPKRALLCDINRDLVLTYCSVRDEVQTVL